MYKLYYSPGACSLAVHVALLEVGAKFELENVSVPAGQTKSAEFLKINPRGAVPVLKIDNFILREGAAILTYILDSHKSDLLPNSGLERAEALEWLSFANSTLHPAYSRCFFQHRILGDAAKDNPLYKPSIAAIQKYWDEIEERLSARNYLCGDKITIADILITVIANWSFAFKEPIKFGAKTKAFFTRVISRPSYQKAMEIEKVTYKANA
ncbi:MAG: glutathione S-transferase family protein [Proteobacteria bacterium]|nr:glutathione S-transferase family protein [Pseudomonadota bacterium]